MGSLLPPRAAIKTIAHAHILIVVFCCIKCGFYDLNSSVDCLVFLLNYCPNQRMAQMNHCVVKMSLLFPRQTKKLLPSGFITQALHSFMYFISQHCFLQMYPAVEALAIFLLYFAVATDMRMMVQTPRSKVTVV